MTHRGAKYYQIQKIRECTWWAHKKAEAFQANEAQHHKCDYNK